MTTQHNLLELAKQGNAQAIATLLNRSLQPKGITAKANLKDSCLHVILEAAKTPDQQTLVAFLQKCLENLGSPAFQKAKVYGKSICEDFPTWTHSFELKANLLDESPYQATQTTQPREQSKAALVIQQTTEAQSKPIVAASKKPIAVHRKSTNYAQPAKTQTKDYGYELLGFLMKTLENWTLLKTAYTFLAVGGLLLIVAIPSLGGSTNSIERGILMLPISLVFLGIGFYCLHVDNRQKAEKTVSGLVKEAIKEFKQKNISTEIVPPNEFRQLDNLGFAVAGVSYENKVVAYYEKEHLGSVAVGNENWATAMPVTNNKPVYIDITGKGVVVEIIVHNNQKTNDTLSSQSFYLIDQHLNQYSEHPMSAYVSAVRQGITNETNLRPNMKAKYFIAFDVNHDSVALMLTTKSKSEKEKIVFSLDLEQKIVM